MSSDENSLNRTRDKPRATNRSELPGEYDPRRTMAETRRTSTRPYAFPEPKTPKSLTRSQGVSGFVAYNVTNLLQAGTNTIEVLLLEPIALESMSWAPKMAIDGRCRLKACPTEEIDLKTADWTAVVTSKDSSRIESGVVAMGMARQPGVPFPSLVFRGVAHRKPQFVLPVGLFRPARLGVLAAVLLLLGWIVRIRVGRRRISTRGSRGSHRWLMGMSLPAGCVLLTAVLLESAFRERHEILWFKQPLHWQLIFMLAATASLAVLACEALAAMRPVRLREQGTSRRDCCFTAYLKRGLGRPCCWRSLGFCFFLRAYQLDLQPLDDDEYASTQAILAIAETGVPQFVPEKVWYTRSPLFHYLMAAVAYVWGPNLWALRLPAAGFAVATTGLAYLCGSQLLRNPWVGMAAVILLTLHPLSDLHRAHHSLLSNATVLCPLDGLLFLSGLCKRTTTGLAVRYDRRILGGGPQSRD